MIVLETERLILRHVELGDTESLYGVFGDVEVMRFGIGAQTLAWVKDWIAEQQDQYATRGFGAWAVMLKTSGGVIGYCGLFDFPDVNGQPEVEIGYRLARAHWGYGYATEAVTGVRDYAFETLGMRRLIAMIDPHNSASIRVAIKAGMKYESDVMFDGYDHPDHVYAIEQSNFEDGTEQR